jgi:hypothetical protein
VETLANQSDVDTEIQENTEILKFDSDLLARKLEILLENQGFFIFEVHSRHWSNLYLQGATKPGGGQIYLEITGPMLTSPNLGWDDVSKMAALSWQINNDSENFGLVHRFDSLETCLAVAEFGLFCLAEVFDLNPDNLEGSFTLELE